MKGLVKRAGILGMGTSIPQRVLTNHDLEKMVDTSDEWIRKRTGIVERRLLDKGAPAFGMGVEAAREAIADAGLKPSDIDAIITATISPDYLSPSMSCIIQSHIGASEAAAFDINAACSGFVYALGIANQYVLSGCYRYILVVSCEAISRLVDWQDRNTCVLFGDGAGAAVVGPVDEDHGILALELGADGTLGHNLTIPCCYFTPDDLAKRAHENKQVIWMDGSEVFKFATRALVYAAERVMEKAGITLDSVRLVVPHQANIRILENAMKRLGVEMERVYVNLDKYGNMSAVSIPVALYEAFREGRLQKGDYVLLVGFGGGLTWASCLLKWNR